MTSHVTSRAPAPEQRRPETARTTGHADSYPTWLPEPYQLGPPGCTGRRLDTTQSGPSPSGAARVATIQPSPDARRPVPVVLDTSRRPASGWLSLMLMPERFNARSYPSSGDFVIRVGSHFDMRCPFIILKCEGGNAQAPVGIHGRIISASVERLRSARNTVSAERKRAFNRHRP